MTVHHFLKYLEVEKRYSDKTIKAYANDLSQFEEFLQTEAGHFAFNKLTSYDVRQWIMELMQLNYSPISINRKISTLRSYSKYLMRQGKITKDPLAGITTPKSPKRLPVFIKPSEMEMLLDEIPFEDSYEGVRDKLVLEMLYDTGLRVSELASIRHKQIDEGEGVLRVIGKRNKERMVPLNRRLLKSIQQLKKYQMAEYGDLSPQLFVTNKGEPAYVELIYRIVKKHLARVTTQDKKSPHVLRHSFASVLLNNGAELNVIKELLGHANLSATEVYTHSTFKDLTNAYKQAHPRA